jgi:hypothetical protein
VRQSPVGKNVSTEAEDTVGSRYRATTCEEAVHAVANYGMCDLAIVL